MTELGLVRIFGTEIGLSDVITAAVVLVVTAALAVALRQGILRYSERESNAHRATWYTVSRVVAYTVIAAGVLFAISALGVPLSRFAVLVGALGVGLGFGLQTIFSNFVSGLILLFDKSIKVGDFVELESGVTGEVRDIRIRATRIVTNDNIDILVPNSEFVGGRVVNWTHRDVSRRLRVPFGVSYSADKDAVKGAALEAAAELPFTLAHDGPRRPQVWLVGFGDSSLDFELVVWLTAEATKRPAAVTAAYNWELHTALERHGIEIPFPQRDLHLRSLFGLGHEEARRALRLEDPGVVEAKSPEPGPDHHGNDAIDDVAGEAATLPGEPEDHPD